jgi:hypothetical protein
VLNPTLMRALAVKYLAPRSAGNAAGASAAGAAAATPVTAVGSTGSYPPNAGYAGPANAATVLPAGVRIGSSYSRSRRLWRDDSGNLFDTQGKAVV